MKSNIEELLQQALIELKNKAIIPHDLSIVIRVDRTKDPLHGDYSTNLALMIAKPCAKNPRECAELIIQHLSFQDTSIERVEIAGPGFINFFAQMNQRHQVVGKVLLQAENYGKSESGSGQRILLEFVSANPTGPLHVGNGRGAALGASLANLLRTAGYDVTREYYVNDAGRQMNILAVSAWLRYLTLAGETILFPVNGYRGDYVNEIAQDLLNTIQFKAVKPWSVIQEGLPADEIDGGDKEIYIDAVIERAKNLLGDELFAIFHQRALTLVLEDIRQDLAEFGVEYENWFSEQSLLDDGSIPKGIDSLKQAGFTYEQGGALWFRSTELGDEKDRVLVRANGQTTYFASDVAYHWNKYERGFDRVINLFGADHHGYVARLRAAVTALGHNKDALTILLVQFAILYRNGERVQMSTRSGSFVTLRELREEVGNDAARFFYVMRKPEQHMDFDLDLAKSESSDNPVYYIQYAHARISSIFRQIEARGLIFQQQLGLENVSLLTTSHEQTLIDLASRYPEMIEIAAQCCEPHQVAYFLREVATALHAYYNAVPILCEDESLRNARLCLLATTRQILRNGMQILGVSAPESM